MFTPADRLSAVTRALSLKFLDVCVIDLEDAVSIHEKKATRENISSFFNSRTTSNSQTPRPASSYPRVMIRINCPITTPFGLDDITSLQSYRQHIDAILIPKVESPNTITEIAMKLNRVGPLPEIWCMVESAKGVEEVERICRHPSVTGIVFGSNDMTKDLQSSVASSSSSSSSSSSAAAVSSVDRLHLLYAMSRSINAARAHSKIVIDGVYMNLNDDTTALLEKEARQGCFLGFDGKSLIHPKQITTVNRVYSPTTSDVEVAGGLIKAFAQAQVAGKGVCVYEGRLIEALHVHKAEEMIALYESLLQRGE